MKIRLVETDAGLEAQGVCEHCRGKGIKERAKVRTVAQDMFTILSVLDNLQKQEYKAYAKENKLSWLQRVEGDRFFEVGLGILALCLVAGLRFSPNFHSPSALAILFLVAVIVWMLLSPHIHASIQRESRASWQASRKKAQERFAHNLGLEEGQKAALFRDGKTRERDLREADILVVSTADVSKLQK